MTRSYDFTISRGTLSPDGVNRSMLLINGQFPGPLIEANWGDTISVTVHNAIETATEDGITVDQEGTALHWHGILQHETPYYDGTPGVQQCPIAPNKDFTYTFTADLYGTSWYHSHYSAQYDAGALGPMIIHGPSSAEYDIDVGPVMIGDWNHQDYYRITQMAVGSEQQIVVSNNTLINGKMDYDCGLLSLHNEPHTCTENAGLSKFKFQSGKTHRLRLINPSAEATLIYSIDSHTMTVIATDFVDVQPFSADYVTLGVGQRMDVLVEGTGNDDGAYWMRVNASTCSAAQQGKALAAIYYENADTTSVPADNPVAIVDSCGARNGNVDYQYLNAVPSFARAPPAQFSTELTLNMSVGFNASCSTLWQMNTGEFPAGDYFQTDYNDPVTLDAYNGKFDFDPQRYVYDVGTNSTVVLYIINTSPAAHPMHLHGHNFWVLASGNGEWDGAIHTADPTNPLRRDVQMVNPAETGSNGYAVIAYETNNPGIWPFHCHIAWHVSAGLYANIMEQKSNISSIPNVPSIIGETCTDWDAFTSTTTVNQIDSGLRIIKAKA